MYQGPGKFFQGDWQGAFCCAVQNRVYLSDYMDLKSYLPKWQMHCPFHSSANSFRFPETAGRGARTLSAKFDIFMRQPDGQPIWVKAVETLEDAKRQVVALAQAVPGDYFIFNAMNGQTILS